MFHCSKSNLSTSYNDVERLLRLDLAYVKPNDTFIPTNYYAPQKKTAPKKRTPIKPRPSRKKQEEQRKATEGKPESSEAILAQSSPCYTIRSIVTATYNQNGEHYNPFSRAWSRSFVETYRDSDGGERNFRETGGFIFLDKSDNNLKVYEVQGKGTYKQLVTGPEEFTALVNSFKRENKDMVFLMMYHTHPQNDLEASAGMGD